MSTFAELPAGDTSFCSSSFAMAGYVSNPPSSVIVIVVSCLILFPVEKVHSEPVNITTTTGILGGVIDGNSATFLGIPYAEPPIGSLRFKAPVPKTPWEGTRAADKHGASCPQDMQSNPKLQDLPEEARVVGEDCLTLNVYSPADAVSAAVMVWLHGGSFETGQAAAYDGVDLASRGVVVVTLNYRLGPLGFLSTGDDSSTGNYGLLDQRLALQWVKDNIAEFGGDPTKVTLFGHDVGANSILQHLAMSDSRDLFSRAILQSISSSYPLESVNNVVHAEALAAAVGCVGTEYVNCLRALPLYDLMNGQEQVKSGHHESLVWGPVTTFGTQTLQDVGAKHDLIVGFSSSDGSRVLDRVGRGALSPEAWEAYSGRFVLDDKEHGSSHGDGGERSILQAALNHEYLIAPNGDSTDGMLRLQQAVDLDTDSRYLLPSVVLLQHVAILAQSVYLYVFDQQNNSDNGYPSWLKGAPHGSILPYVWGESVNDSAWSTEEGAVSDAIMTYWTNFAKYGSPNQLNSAVMWPENEDASNKYIHLQAQNVVALQAYRASKVDFWLNWLPELTEFSQCDEDGDERDECDGVLLGGTVGLTASEAGVVIVVLLIVLGVFGLLCIVLLTATCGYRERSKAILRAQMRDTEMGQKSLVNAYANLPPTIAVSMDDLPPPPPPPPMDTEDTKPLIPESPASSESPSEEAPPTLEADNEAMNDDEEVRQALKHMDSVVDNADTASVDIGDGGKPGDAQMEDTDQKPKMDEEVKPHSEEPAVEDEAPKSEEPAVEDEAPKNEEPAVEDDVPVPHEEEEEVPAKTEPEVEVEMP